MQSIEELINAQFEAQKQAEMERKQNLEAELQKRLARQTPNFNMAPMAAALEQLSGLGSGVSNQLQAAANQSAKEQSEIDALSAQMGKTPGQGGGNAIDQALKLRGQDMKQQLDQQKAGQTKLPAGYEVAPDGGLQPIRGTKDWRASEKEGRQLQSQKDTVTRAGQTLIRDATTAIQNIDKYGRRSAGFGSLLKAIPESKANELAADIASIQGNVAVDQLLKIKAQGAGLGQVPQAQLEMLASLLGGLRQDMEPQKLRSNLQDIVKIYNDVVTSAGGDPFEMAAQRGWTPELTSAPAVGGAGGTRQPAPRPDPFAAERARRTGGGEGQ